MPVPPMTRPFTLHLSGAAMLGGMISRTGLLLCALLLAGPATGTPPQRPPAPDKAQDRARDAVLRGEILPLERILAMARARHAGEVVGVELDGDEYEIEILRPDGVVVELEYDARSGRLIEEEVEDD